MSSYRLRPTSRGDSAAVAQLICDLEIALLGRAEYSPSELEAEWRTMDVEADTWVAVEGSLERPVAYATIELRADHAVLDGYVDPAHHGRGVGARVARFLEEEARRRGAARVRNAVLAVDGPAQQLLVAQGYREVRRFWQMRIDLTGPPAPPRWPGDVGVSRFEIADAARFQAAQAAAFADHWGAVPDSPADFAAATYERPDFDPELCAVVTSGGEVVAGTICLPERMGVGWVSRLFTVRHRRGEGIGAALLADAFGRFWERGQHSVGLGVDAESQTGANRLYERAGMHVHWSAVVFEKELV